jgi:glycosyltransferase involved in cell wall biosynthesis
VTVLRGQYAGDRAAAQPSPADPLVVFVGRLIPEKRVTALVTAIAEARLTLPTLQAAVFGDGPDRTLVERLVVSLGLTGVVSTPGFVDEATIDDALQRALCLVLPSRREGYGLVVVEAAARGTPSVIVDGPDNAATELLVEGENGVVAPSASPQALAAAIARVYQAGPSLRASTATWFARNAVQLSLRTSVATVTASYAALQSLGDGDSTWASAGEQSVQR